VHLLRQVAAGLLVALALGLALRPAAPGAPPAERTVPVLVAAADLTAGTVLDPADLSPTDLPERLAPDGVGGAASALAGRVLAGPVRRGEVLTDVRLVGPGFWAQVPPGQVAAPVRLADLAVATLLQAGDRVDVLAGAAGTGAAEVVAAGALVLSAPVRAAPDESPPDVPEAAGLLVLAVPPDTARVLAGAATTGSLTVTLGPP
jgi:pilus assembly protein CpaB